MTDDSPIDFLHAQIAAGEHWYIAMLKTMARWTLAEETIGERCYRYLIGGEAFDWLVLAERLLDELDGPVTAEDRDDLLFNGRPPLEIEEDEFQSLIGTPKYQAYLNYLYGVTVEEALHYAVEEEIAKEMHGYVWTFEEREERTLYRRIYGRSQDELLDEFRKERGLEPGDSLQLGQLKEFTYWLFKYRVRTADGARVASDTRKGLAALSGVEAAHRGRHQTQAAEAV